MRSIWKGVVSFGLVTIPIRLYSATEEHDVPLHQVHEKDGSRVRYRRVCEAEGVEIPYAEIAKGYELPDGETVVITDEELKSLPIASSRTIDVLSFVPDEQIPGVYLNKSYYLQADGAGIKPYVLLRDALAAAGSSALVKVALRQRESLAVLRPFGDVLLMQTMLWPDEIRDAGSIAPPEDIELRPQELQMAQSYIDALVGNFEPDEYTDEYAEALRSMVEAKAAGRELTRPAEPAARSGEVIDLMAALEASVAEARAGRGSARSATGAPDRASSGSRSAAKSAPAKATGSTRAPAKSTAKSTAKSAAGSRAGKSAAAGKSAGGPSGGEKDTTKASGKAGKRAAKETAAAATTKTNGKPAAKSEPKKRTSARRSA